MALSGSNLFRQPRGKGRCNLLVHLPVDLDPSAPFPPRSQPWGFYSEALRFATLTVESVNIDSASPWLHFPSLHGAAVTRRKQGEGKVEGTDDDRLFQP
jgi:hypothetical protein